MYHNTEKNLRVSACSRAFSAYTGYCKVCRNQNLLKIDRSVMLNFVGQFDWTTRWPNIWLNIALGLSVKVFLDGLIFTQVDWRRQIALPKVGELCLISWSPEWNRKADLPPVKEELLPDCCAGTLFISCLRVQTETSALLDPSLPTVDLGTCLPL